MPSAWREALSLPIGPHMTGAEQDRVIDVVLEFSDRIPSAGTVGRNNFRSPQ